MRLRLKTALRYVLMLGLALTSYALAADPVDPLIQTIQNEACYRAHSGLRNFPPQHKAKELFGLLTHLRKISEDPNVEGFVESEVVAKFQRAIETGQPVQMYIPCFPAKSPNHVNKTLGALPDMAERIAIERLSVVVNAMNEIHPTELVIASDGRMFAETWWSSEKGIDAYRDALRTEIQTPHVKLMDLGDYFPGLTAAQAREKVLQEYGPSVEEIKKSIEADPERMKLYLAFTRFIEGDTHPDDPAIQGISKNARTRLFKERAIDDIRRSDALNRFLEQHFVKDKKYIRLSIRDSVDTPEKIGINLLESEDREFSVSPWHSVIVVFPDGRYKAMKRKEAEDAGYQLIHRNGRPDHFVAK